MDSSLGMSLFYLQVPQAKNSMHARGKMSSPPLVRMVVKRQKDNRTGLDDIQFKKTAKVVLGLWTPTA